MEAGLGRDGGGGLVTKSCLTFVTPWTVARQVPLPMGFSRQEYWSGLPFPSPGDLPNPGIKPRSPAFQANSLLTELRRHNWRGGWGTMQGLMDTLFWAECLWPLKTHLWSPSPWCHGVRRRGLGKVIRIEWGHGGGTLVNGSGALMRVTESLWAHREVCNPEEGPTRPGICQRLDLGRPCTPNSRLDSDKDIGGSLPRGHSRADDQSRWQVAR